MKIKNLIAFTIVFVLLAVFWSLANAFTYEGKYDPKEFYSWTEIKIIGVWPDGNRLTIIQEPKTFDIVLLRTYMYLVVNDREFITGYAYYDQDQLVVFERESIPDTPDHFGQRSFIPEALKKEISRFLDPYIKSREV